MKTRSLFAGCLLTAALGASAPAHAETNIIFGSEAEKDPDRYVVEATVKSTAAGEVDSSFLILIVEDPLTAELKATLLGPNFDASAKFVAGAFNLELTTSQVGTPDDWMTDPSFDPQELGGSHKVAPGGKFEIRGVSYEIKAVIAHTPKNGMSYGLESGASHDGSGLAYTGSVSYGERLEYAVKLTKKVGAWHWLAQSSTTRANRDVTAAKPLAR